MSRGALAAAFLVLAATACTTGGGGGISPPTFTVTASSATIQFGDAIPTVTASYAGLPDGETEPDTLATCTTAATSTSPPGVYDTACINAAEFGYLVNTVLGTITIEAAPVTVTASSGSMPFGGSVPTITASYSGLKNGATAPAVLPVCSTTATSDSDVGSYPSSCSGAVDPNYEFNYVDGSVSVGTAVVTVTASSATSTYGDTVPAITATYSGFQAGQTVPANPANCSTPATSTSPAGGYPTSCSGASDPNYTFSYVGGSVTIAKAPVVVTASSGAVAFHATPPAITASYSGLVNGATHPATLPVCSTTATSSSPVGIYPTTCSGAADPNYTFSYVNGSMVVTAAAAPVVVTASSATISYGEAVPAITAAYSGFTGGQTTPATLPTCSTTATSTSPVGTYPTTCVGAADPNFTFTNVNGSITIAKAAAIVTASSGSMSYGGTVPAVTPSFSGLVNGQLVPATAPTCSTTATSSSPVGAYPTTCSGAADPNYTFNAVAGSISVNKADLTVTASSATMSLGGAAPTITGAITGFVNGETTVTTPPTCTSAATSASPIGRQASNCSGAVDSDYTFTYVPGSVQVNPTDGYAEYDPSAISTTIAAASNGLTLPRATINVASGTGAGFGAYVNLTIQTSAGPQSVFCKTAAATSFGSCSGGTGTMSTGNSVVRAPANQFDVYTVGGGKTVLAASSLTILSDVPALNRGMASSVTATANNGLVNYMQSATPTGNFSLTYGICRTGTATYSAGNANCATGVLNYRPGVASNMGADVTVTVIFPITSHQYQTMKTAVATPATVAPGQTFTTRIAPSAGAIPAFQPAPVVGEVTVNSSAKFTSVYPIPAGTTFQSARLIGGDATTSGVATFNYCIATSANCTAKLTGNYAGTTTPYVIVTLPTGFAAGGASITMPTLELTLTAGPTAGVAPFKLTEVVNQTNTSAATATFDAYPTTGNADVTPPMAPPTVLATTTIG